METAARSGARHRGLWRWGIDPERPAATKAGRLGEPLPGPGRCHRRARGGEWWGRHVRPRDQEEPARPFLGREDVIIKRPLAAWQFVRDFQAIAVRVAEINANRDAVI